MIFRNIFIRISGKIFKRLYVIFVERPYCVDLSYYVAIQCYCETQKTVTPGTRFSKAPETFRARKAIFSSSVPKSGEVYTPET